MIKKLFPWIPAVALAIALPLVMMNICRPNENPPTTPVEIVPSAKPLAKLNLEVIESQLTPGRAATLLNGLCNESDEPIIVEVYLAAQKQSSDPLIDGETFPIVQRAAGSEQGRGATRTIEPGCIFSGPIPILVPIGIPTGRWRLFLEVVWRGDSSVELQRETAFSGYFEVINP